MPKPKAKNSKAPKTTKPKGIPNTEKTGDKFELKEVTSHPSGLESGVFYLHKTKAKTEHVAFVDPFTEKEVFSSLGFLKVKVEKKSPLTLTGVINLAPVDHGSLGDFEGSKPFHIVNGEVLLVKPKPEKKKEDKE